MGAVRRPVETIIVSEQESDSWMFWSSGGDKLLRCSDMVAGGVEVRWIVDVVEASPSRPIWLEVVAIGLGEWPSSGR